MSEQNKAIVLQAYDAFKKGDIERLLSLMADDITWTLPEMQNVPFGGSRSGLDSVADFFSQVNATQESLSFEPDKMVAEGDTVVSLGNYNWRVKATNREFKGDFAHVFKIRNGKVIEFHEYTDTAACVKAHQKAMSA